MRTLRIKRCNGVETAGAMPGTSQRARTRNVLTRVGTDLGQALSRARRYMKNPERFARRALRKTLPRISNPLVRGSNPFGLRTNPNAVRSPTFGEVRRRADGSNPFGRAHLSRGPAGALVTWRWVTGVLCSDTRA
jgi:hypothetical protein